MCIRDRLRGRGADGSRPTGRHLPRRQQGAAFQVKVSAENVGKPLAV
jgi:hypothetical protein